VLFREIPFCFSQSLENETFSQIAGNESLISFQFSVNLGTISASLMISRS